MGGRGGKACMERGRVSEGKGGIVVVGIGCTGNGRGMGGGDGGMEEGEERILW